MINQPQIDEKALLLRLRVGDHHAFTTIYDLYSEKITAKLFRLLKSWEQAEESLQELFVKVWENRERIDPDKSFQAYLYSIATNIVNDYFRSVAKDRALAGRLAEHLHFHAGEISIEQVRLDQELMRTIEQLPPQRKVIFKMCKLEGKSYAEVSRMLSISEATIGEHISKANKFLQQHYDKGILLGTLLQAFTIYE